MKFVQVSFFGAAILGIAASFILKPFKEDEPRLLVAPPPGLEYLHFGYNEPIADSLWLRAIQDFDYCEAEIAAQVCQGSGWLYQMLDTITNLSPQYRIVYATGASTLSVIVNDIEGASKFFDKAVIAFPKDWPILYRAAYHALIEEKNNRKAADLLVAAAKNGGNSWFNSLAAKLYGESGNREAAETLVRRMVEAGEDPVMIKRMQDRLKSQQK